MGRKKREYTKALRYIIIVQVFLVALFMLIVFLEHGLHIPFREIRGVLFLVLLSLSTDLFFVREITGKMSDSEKEEFYAILLQSITKSLNLVEKKKEEVNVYLHLAAISMDVTFEYNIKEDVMILYGNYSQILNSKFLEVQTNYLEFLKTTDAIEDGYKEVIKNLLSSFPQGEDSLQIECLFKSQNDEFEWYSVTIAYYDENKERLIGTIRNINNQVNLIEELRSKAHADSFTGLLNKETTVEYINLALKEDNAGTFLMIDIDNFKHFNDTYGHLTGDRVIKEVAKLLRDNFRGQDIIGRVGGDEFVVFMRGTTNHRMVDERIVALMSAVEEVGSTIIESEDASPLTLSIGACECGKVKNYEELCALADQAMYQMKAKGKNSFAWYSEDMALPLIVASKDERRYEITHILSDLLMMKLRGKSNDAILRYVAETFDINDISVYKEDIGELLLIEHYNAFNEEAVIPDARVVETLSYDENGLFYQNHYTDVRGKQCTLMCLKIQKNDILLGYIIFKDNDPSYYWTEDEKSSIEILAYYLCNELYSDMKLIRNRNLNNTINQIVSNISNQTYIVDKDTYQIWYDSSTGDLDGNELCYKHIYGISEPCKNCPLKTHIKGNGLESVRFETHLGESAIAVVNDIEINGNEYVCVCLNEVSNTAQFADKQRRHLIGAIYRNIDAIMEMPVDSPRAIFYKYINGDLEKYYEIDYDETFMPYAELVDENQREEYQRLFTRKQLIKNLTEKRMHEVTMDYGRTTKSGEHSYVRRVSTLIRNERNEEIIYTYITKIDELMNSHITSEGYIDSLTNMYEDICELDLDNGKLRCIYRKHEMYRSDYYFKWNESAIVEDITNTIHPDDKQAFLNFFNKDNILEASKDGNDIYMEYRVRKSDMYEWYQLRIVFNRIAKNKANLYLKNVNEEHERIKEQNEINERSNRLARRLQQISSKNLGNFYLWNITDSTISYIAPNKESCVVTLQAFVDFVCKATITDEDKTKVAEFLKVEHVNQLRESNAYEAMITFDIMYYGEHRVSQMILNLYKDNESEYADLLIMDISEKIKMQELKKRNDELMISDQIGERFKLIAIHTGTMVCEWRVGKGIVYCDERVKEKYAGDYEKKNDIFQIWMEDNVVHPEDAKILSELFKLNQDHPHGEVTVRLLLKSGGYRYSRLAMTFIYENDKLARALCTINDVDQQVKAEMDLKYRAEYDTLTGLFNYDSFVKYTKQLFADYPNSQYAIVQFDIERFKLINDVYGRDKGDMLLRYIADILRHNLTKQDSYCRMNSDVFLMCVSYDNEDKIIQIIDNIIDGIEQFPSSYKVMASFGICRCEDRSVPIHTMVDWSNLALKKIKGSYINKYWFYDDVLRQKMVNEKQLEAEMKKALTNKEFQIYFQPKVGLQSGEIEGAEALVRWVHPERGIISPGEFLPLFERNGFIVELDNYVWEEVCHIMREWMDANKKVVPISVNVSRMNIYTPQFADHICEFTKQYRIDNSMLELELTESVFLENPTELFNTMSDLQKLGFSLAMDDFGSGYSSLNMLRNVPIDVLKIDRAFFDERFASESGPIIVDFTIELAHRLHIKVVAEGVETVEQKNFLKESSCDIAQGYLFSKPVPREVFEELLNKTNVES